MEGEDPAGNPAPSTDGVVEYLTVSLSQLGITPTADVVDQADPPNAFAFAFVEEYLTVSLSQLGITEMKAEDPAANPAIVEEIEEDADGVVDQADPPNEIKVEAPAFVADGGVNQTNPPNGHLAALVQRQQQLERLLDGLQKQFDHMSKTVQSEKRMIKLTPVQFRQRCQQQLDLIKQLLIAQGQQLIAQGQQQELIIQRLIAQGRQQQELIIQRLIAQGQQLIAQGQRLIAQGRQQLEQRQKTGQPLQRQREQRLQLPKLTLKQNQWRGRGGLWFNQMLAAHTSRKGWQPMSALMLGGGRQHQLQQQHNVQAANCELSFRGGLVSRNF